MTEISIKPFKNTIFFIPLEKLLIFQKVILVNNFDKRNPTRALPKGFSIRRRTYLDSLEKDRNSRPIQVYHHLIEISSRGGIKLPEIG